MRDHLLEMIGAVQDMRQKGGKLTDRQIADLEEHYDILVGDGIDQHGALAPLCPKRKGRPRRRTGHNLAIRLCDYRTETLRFLRNPAVPTSNNAEQDLRPLKIKKKFSGSFRTATGAGDFVILRSLIEIARKQSWNLLSTLQANPELLIARPRTSGPVPET